MLQFQPPVHVPLLIPEDPNRASSSTPFNQAFVAEYNVLPIILGSVLPVPTPLQSCIFLFFCELQPFLAAFLSIPSAFVAERSVAFEQMRLFCVMS